MTERDLSTMSVEEMESEYDDLKNRKMHNTHRGKALREALKATPGIEIGTKEGEAAQEAAEQAVEKPAKTKGFSVSTPDAGNQRFQLLSNVFAAHVARNGFRRKDFRAQLGDSSQMYEQFHAWMLGGDNLSTAEELREAQSLVNTQAKELARLRSKNVELQRVHDEHVSLLKANELPY